MCEQSEVRYLEGDVVWVKLGPCWWPGEVQDFEKMEPDIVKGFKKPPLAVVKFFQEDAYEYVKNLNQIYKYNCRKKNEFIKKGLDMHRAKNTFMDKFPADVCHAEALTGGDPDIITSELFAPEQKTSYSQLFGTPNPKKSPKFSPRGRVSQGSQKITNSQKKIVHPRFVGTSDYEVTMLEQSSPTAVSSTQYTCHICGFESTRLNVIVLHNKSHSNGTYISPKQKPKSKLNSQKKGKKLGKLTFATTSSIDEDLELIRQGMTISASESSDSESEISNKCKGPGSKRKSNKSKNSNNASKKAKASSNNTSSICNNLLADWGDSDSNEETIADKIVSIENLEQTNRSLMDIENDLSANNENLKIESNSKQEETSKICVELDKVDTLSKIENTENGKVSCFDFEEEEEHTVLEKSPGRKIPRVIPQKRKSSDISSESELNNEKEIEVRKKFTHKSVKDENKLVLIEDEENKKDKEMAEIKECIEESEVIESAFQTILEETAVPDVHAIIDDLKSNQNFQERRIIKSPDKNEESIEKTNGVLSRTDTKLTTNVKLDMETSEAPLTPKKRYVRDFEDFEMFHNEHKIAEEECTKQGPSGLEVSKLKSQLMTKLTTEFPQEQSSEEKEAEDKIHETVPGNNADVPMSETEGTLHEDIEMLEHRMLDKEEEISTEDVDVSEPMSEVSQEAIHLSNQFEDIQSTESTNEPQNNLQLVQQIEEDNVEHQVEEQPVEENMIKSMDNQYEEPMIDQTETSEDFVTEETKELEDTIKESGPIREDFPVSQEEMFTEQHVAVQEQHKDIQTFYEETQERREEFEEQSDPSVGRIESKQESHKSHDFHSPPLDEECSSLSEEPKQSKILVDISDICIDNTDNLSGLTTLAAVSELTGNFVFETSIKVSKESFIESKEETTTEHDIHVQPELEKCKFIQEGLTIVEETATEEDTSIVTQTSTLEKAPEMDETCHNDQTIMVDQLSAMDDSNIVEETTMDNDPHMNEHMAVEDPHIVEGNLLEHITQVEDSNISEETMVVKDSHAAEHTTMVHVPHAGEHGTMVEDPHIYEDANMVEDLHMGEHTTIVEDPHIDEHTTVVEDPRRDEQPTMVEDLHMDVCRTMVDEHTTMIEDPLMDEHVTEVEDPHMVGQTTMVQDPHMGEHRTMVDDPHIGEHTTIVEDPHMDENTTMAAEQHMNEHTTVVEDSNMDEHITIVEEPHMNEHITMVGDAHMNEHRIMVEHETKVEDPHMAEDQHAGEHSSLAEDGTLVDPETIVEPETTVEPETMIEPETVVEITPMVEHENIVETTAMVEDTPTFEYTSVAEETEMVDHSHMIENTTTVEETPMIEESSVVSESQIVEELPVTIEELRVEDIPLPPSPKKVATLANFSMDYSDSNESIPVKKDFQDEIVQEERQQVSSFINDSKIEDVICEKPCETSSELQGNLIENIDETVTTSTVDTSNEVNSFETVMSECENTSSNVNVSTASEYQPFTFIEETPIIASTEEEYFERNEQVIENPEVSLESEMAKLTDTHPDTEEVLQEQQQNTSSSKLLEILTDSNTATSSKKFISTQKTIFTSGANSQKVHMVITGDSKTMPRKFDPKTSKFVIKSTTPKSALGKSNKPIILSEKIIKPVTESDCVSVKKVTSKRTYQDVEDIDTFIIQKPTKKSNTSDNDMQDIILTPKVEVSRQQKGMTRARGKPKIIEQTIIKAADIPGTTESGPLLDDSMFDINSMPIVLSDQILTPENIESMPVVMSDLIPVSVSNSPTTSIITEKSQIVKRGGTLQQIKLLNKSKLSQVEASPKLGQTVVKNIMPRGLAKNQKVYQSSTKLLKNNPAVITQPGKPGKFIILPTSTSTSSPGSKYTVGKRMAAMKGVTNVVGSATPTTSRTKGIQSLASEPTGNKIMIVTNNQGVQSRVLLTPAQQKLLTCKMPGTKITKTQSTQQIKGGLIHPKSILTSKGTLLTPINSGLVTSQKSPLMTQTIMTSKGQIFTSTTGQTIVTSEGQVLTPLTPQQLRSMKTETMKCGRKVQGQSRLLLPEKALETTPKGKLNIMGGKKTILIKGPQGQTIKKFASPGLESKNMYLQSGQKQTQLLSLTGQQMQQAGISGKQVLLTSKGQVIKSDAKVNIGKQASERVNIQRMSKTPTRIPKSKTQMLLSPVSSSSVNKQSNLASAVSVPPLAPITANQSRKSEHLLQIQTDQSQIKLKDKEKLEGVSEQKHLIIQDAMGNQTTVTEGQILALPSEAVDGQPQSYMLVTVDETGNLAPISNETLMSLDPSLALGGDMSNIVLQIDQGNQESQAIESKSEVLPMELPVESQTFTNQTMDTSEQQMMAVGNQQMLLDQTASTEAEQQIVMSEGQQMFVSNKEQETYVDESHVVTAEPQADTQTVACNINTGDSSQQLIITGDPESTQKFLASLSEGNTDLSSLLTGAEGNIIINTDGQQILLNTDSDNQILLSVNSDNLGLIQTSAEEDMSQSAMYVTQQAIKNQDILAAALADTDVFQQDSTSDKLSVTQELPKISNTIQSQLSPNNSLYPMNVGNVLETSLTLGSPIMTPLEVPSIPKKKMKRHIESSLLSHVPSSLELPITITDPNISQTVSHQVMLGNEMQSNLDLPISIGDTGISSIHSTEMSSSSFVYSLPSLDDHTDIDPKPSYTESISSPVVTSGSVYNTALTGSMSMPLLTEEPDLLQQTTETQEAESVPVLETVPDQIDHNVTELETKTTTEVTDYPVTSESLQDESEADLADSDKMGADDLQMGPIDEELDLQSSDICDSLSEPPPGMFDKSSFTLGSSSSYLNNKDEIESVSDIPLPPDLTPPMNTVKETSSLPILTENAEAPNNDISNDNEQTEATNVSDETATESNLEMDFEDSEQPNMSDAPMNQEIPPSDVSNSELNSPQLDIDENSVEIPVQPAIVTNLSESNMSTDFGLDEEENRKREGGEVENYITDAKRSRLSCD